MRSQQNDLCIQKKRKHCKKFDSFSNDWQGILDSYAGLAQPKHRANFYGVQNTMYWIDQDHH